MLYYNILFTLSHTLSKYFNIGSTLNNIEKCDNIVATVLQNCHSQGV